MRTARIIYALAGLFALCVPMLASIDLHDETSLLGDVRLRLQSPLGVQRMLSFGHAAFLGPPLTQPPGW